MRIVICEDEEKYTEQLVEYINKWAASRNVKVDIFAHITAEHFLYEWADGENYDMLFLDIRMGGLTGMELAGMVRRTNKDIPIVFVTNMREYALEGYSVDAMHFLLKPVREEDCFACLDRVYESDRNKKYFLFNDIDKTFRIPHEDIIYIEMFSHNAEMVMVHPPTAGKGEYNFRKTITQILEELDDDLFVKCHKSYIINIRHVEAVSKTFAFMSNKSEIPLSKNIAKEIYDRFRKYNISRVGR